MQFEIAHDHSCLPGHFPGNPVVPGVLLLDRVLDAVEATGAAPGVLRLPQVKFLQPLLPGQHAEVHLDAPAPGRWRFRVTRDDVLLASGEIVDDAATAA